MTDQTLVKCRVCNFGYVHGREGEARRHAIYHAQSFQRWLRATRITNDAAGDLIKDLRRDLRDNPKEFPSPHTVLGLARYLAQWDPCPGALVAASVVWGRYRRWVAERQ